MRRTVLWILAAVAGVLVVAGVTAAASTLSTQTIGLSSEPPSAGSRLAPARTATPTPKATPRPRRKPRKPRATPTPTATPPPVVTPVPTVDDHGGRGRGGDDDRQDEYFDDSGRGGDDDD